MEFVVDSIEERGVRSSGLDHDASSILGEVVLWEFERCGDSGGDAARNGPFSLRAQDSGQVRLVDTDGLGEAPQRARPCLVRLRTGGRQELGEFFGEGALGSMWSRHASWFDAALSEPAHLSFQAV